MLQVDERLECGPGLALRLNGAIVLTLAYERPPTMARIPPPVSKAMRAPWLTRRFLLCCANVFDKAASALSCASGSSVVSTTIPSSIRPMKSGICV